MKPYLGGVPTDADVQKISDALMPLGVGDQIDHAEIESIIGLDRNASRYRTITAAWRKLLRKDHNIELLALAGVGFRVMSPDERIDAGVSGVKAGARKQIRSINIAVSAKTEDRVLAHKQAVLNRYGIEVMRQLKETTHGLALPAPPSPAPRRVQE